MCNFCPQTPLPPPPRRHPAPHWPPPLRPHGRPPRLPPLCAARTPSCFPSAPTTAPLARTHARTYDRPPVDPPRLATTPACVSCGPAAVSSALVVVVVVVVLVVVVVVLLQPVLSPVSLLVRRIPPCLLARGDRLRRSTRVVHRTLHCCQYPPARLSSLSARLSSLFPSPPSPHLPPRPKPLSPLLTAHAPFRFRAPPPFLRLCSTRPACKPFRLPMVGASERTQQTRARELAKWRTRDRPTASVRRAQVARPLVGISLSHCSDEIGRCMQRD